MPPEASFGPTVKAEDRGGTPEGLADAASPDSSSIRGSAIPCEAMNGSEIRRTRGTARAGFRTEAGGLEEAYALVEAPALAESGADEETRGGCSANRARSRIGSAREEHLAALRELMRAARAAELPARRLHPRRGTSCGGTRRRPFLCPPRLRTSLHSANGTGSSPAERSATSGRDGQFAEACGVTRRRHPR